MFESLKKPKIPKELEGLLIPSELEWYLRTHGYSANEAKHRVALLRRLGIMRREPSPEEMRRLKRYKKSNVKAAKDHDRRGPLQKTENQKGSPCDNDSLTGPPFYFNEKGESTNG